MTNKEFLESITLEGEEWRDVVGYEELYVVSNLGRFASLKRSTTTRFGWVQNIPAKLMKPINSRSGHLIIILCKNGVPKHEGCHRLVALAFIPNINNMPIVEHLNCNPADNRVENLRWTDQKGNMSHPITRERQSKSAKKKDMSRFFKQIVCIHPNGTNTLYQSIVSAEKDGFLRYGIIKSCKDIHTTYKKCKFMYLSDYEASNQ